MSFSLLLCGPGAEAALAFGAALVEELAGRGITARVLSDVEASPAVRACAAGELARQVRELRAAGAAAICVLARATPAEREAVAAAFADAVIVDWPGAGFLPSAAPHQTLPEDLDGRAGLAAIFPVLEGLGYVPMAGSALQPEDDAELVERLRELGYV